jgi:hypothetical protein
MPDAELLIKRIVLNTLGRWNYAQTNQQCYPVEARGDKVD